MLPEFSPDEMNRYSRHLFLPGFGLDGQRKIKLGSVLVIGVGGLGSSVAVYLAAAGLGHIGLVDYDRVDASNLNRQILYDSDGIGHVKVELARQRLLKFNPHIQIDVFNESFGPENAERIARDYAVLVDGTDNLPVRYIANDLCVFSAKPFVYGSVYRYEGQVSVFDARFGPCYRCLYPESPLPGTVPSTAQGGVLGTLPGTIGSLQATEVIKLVLGIGTPLYGNLLVYDALEMTFQSIRITKNPNCKVCHTEPRNIDD